MPFGRGGFGGPSRRYQGIGIDEQDEDQLTLAYGGARPSQGRATSIDTSLLDRQDEEEAYGAQVAMDPSIRRRGPALTGMPSYDETANDFSTPEEIERIGMKPRRFQRFGNSYEYDPRVGNALNTAVDRSRRELAFDIDKTRGVGLELAGDDARVRRLVQAGYSEKEATRQVFGRQGASPDEQVELIEARGAQQMERDKSLQQLIGQRQLDAQRAREAVQRFLEASRSGDRNADRQLRSALGMLDSADRAHAAALRDRQRNALGLDLEVQPPGEDAMTSEARNRVSEVDASEAALESARRAVQLLGTASGGARGAPPPAGGGGVMADDEISRVMESNRPAASPAATPAAPAAPAKKKPTAAMLKHAKEDPEYRADLIARGYDMGVGK